MSVSWLTWVSETSVVPKQDLGEIRSATNQQGADCLVIDRGLLTFRLAGARKQVFLKLDRRFADIVKQSKQACDVLLIKRFGKRCGHGSNGAGMIVQVMPDVAFGGGSMCDETGSRRLQSAPPL